MVIKIRDKRAMKKKSKKQKVIKIIVCDDPKLSKKEKNNV